MDKNDTDKKIGISLFNERAWEVIRGDLDIHQFEKWLYSCTDLESIFEKDFYLELISTNFKDRSEVYLLKHNLEDYLRKTIPLTCECITLANLDVTEMGSEREEEVFKHLVEMIPFGESRWWLALYQCSECHQYWLVAQDSRQNDVHWFKRVNVNEVEEIIQNNIWPKCFETYEELLVIGKKFVKSVQYIDPMDSSLISCIEDMVKARPSITVTEIANLLNLNNEIALKLCKIVMTEKNIKIEGN